MMILMLLLVDIVGGAILFAWDAVYGEFPRSRRFKQLLLAWGAVVAVTWFLLLELAS